MKPTERKNYSWLLGSNYTYPVWNRMMEICGLSIFTVFYIRLCAQTFFRTTELELTSESALLVSAMVLVSGIATLAADFMSGFVHCAADNFGSPKTPVFGTAFIEPFRDHHRDPQGITRHDFIETNGNSAIVCLSVLLPTWFIQHQFFTPWMLPLSAFTLAFSAAIMATNQIHKWSHTPNPPQVVRVLQNLGLFLGPTHHQVHHTAPFDRYYCITTGWMNKPLERIGFFTWLVSTFKNKGDDYQNSQEIIENRYQDAS